MEVKLVVGFPFLCECQCGINQLDDDHNNGFLLACRENHVEIVRYLFQQECGIEQTAFCGENAF